MPSISVTFDGVMDRYAEQLKQLGTQAPVIMTTALMTAAPTMKKALASALTPQTGLPKRTLDKAVKIRPGAMQVTFATYGGDIAVKYFKAYETRAGVSAAPWNRRTVYGGAFMRAGWWPKRVVKGNWNGHAFYRAGGRTNSGKDRFVKAKSGLYIPDEMLKGASIAAWEQGVGQVQTEVENQIAKLLP